MKRFITIIIAFAVLILATASCEKSETSSPVIDQDIVGEWHLAGLKAEDKLVEADIDVYLRLNADCTFELYQKTGTQSIRYDRFTGVCSTDNGLLTGIYSDGTSWGSKYFYSILVDGLLLKSYNLLEVQRYHKVVIPAEVIENANPSESKSGICLSTPIL